MSYTIGVLAFVVGLLLSVMLHEAGHFATAKSFGMKASRFFVGFGPTLWSFRRGETEYGVKALPAGGFVKIEGMTALEELAPEDEPRAFYKQPAGQRLVVLVAGSAVHFVIAIALVFGIIAITHEDPIRTHIKVAALASPTAPAVGHLQPGDLLLAVNGKRVGNNDGSMVSSIVSRSIGQPVTLLIERGGRQFAEVVTPKPERVGGKTIGRIGITEELVSARDSTADAVPRTFGTLANFVTETGKAIGGLPHEVAQILENKPRNPNGAASVVDIGRISGQVASTSDVSVGARVVTLLLILAELNLFVGIFNLLPLLPLDGGHVAILLFEQARTRLYRWIGRSDPGRVDIMKVLPVTYAVVAVFVGLSLILLYAGITNPIQLQ